MERLKRIFGLDRKEQPAVSAPAPAPSPAPSQVVTEAAPSVQLTTETSSVQQNVSVSTVEPTKPKGSFQEMADRTDKFLRQYIPVVEGDCLSCKIIGTTFLMGASAVVLRHGIAVKNMKPPGKKRMPPGYISMAVVLLILGISRAMDNGIFTPRITEEEKNQGLVERFKYLLKKDIETFGSVFKTKEPMEKKKVE